MRDNSCGNTDLLDRDDPDDRFKDLTDRGDLTEQQTSSGGHDLLSHWNAHADEEEESLRDSQFYDQLLASNGFRNASDGSATYVPEEESQRSILGSFLRDSIIREPSREKKSAELQLPDIGDEIFGFHLLHKLGAGTFARVFLAQQGDLADREVVLKVSAIEGTEPQTLAQLQHTHVVPIYSVHENPQCGLRAVCMPYFGGASLNHVLEQVWRKKKNPMQGQALVEALDRASGPEPATRVAQREAAARFANSPNAQVMDSPHTARNILGGLPFVQAAAWVMARLAEGLQHSHERNVIHRDIKPSNILLSAEGQPLLLDFNVSQVVDCNPSDATLGGTLSYMSPEHLEAAITRDASSITTVNHRSDVYSLGLVFYEMLVGELPFRMLSQGSVDPRSLQRMLTERQQAVPSLKKTSPLEIPWSLESIVRKCLSPLPQNRYASAGQLAEDLNRFLADQPLKYAPELSTWERVRKWIRRHPRLTSSTAVSLLAAAVIIPGVALLGLRAVRLRNAEAANYAREFQTETMQSLPQTMMVAPDEEQLHEGIAKCKKTLGIYGVLDNPNWQQNAHWQSLEPFLQRKLSENVRELLLVLADAEVRQAKSATDAVEAALKKVDLAEQIRGLPPSKALFFDRAKYLKLLKRDAEALEAAKLAEKTPATSPHDKYMQAAAHARMGTGPEVKLAVDLLTKAIDQDPSHYWSHFERALCYEELGDSTLAISDLSECIGLLPDSAAAYFNRGHLKDAAGRKQSAEEDYTAAIQHDPQFWSAYFNRGLVRVELQKHDEALADFDKVLQVRPARTVMIAARAIALEMTGQDKEADKQFAAALKLAESDHSVDINRVRWSYGSAVSIRNPTLAKQLFDQVLESDPYQPQANYALGSLLMSQGKMRDAIAAFDSAIKADPNYVEPVRYRAICLARQAKFEGALQDIAFCKDRQPNNPDTLYAEACVAAIAHKKFATSELADRTLQLLQMAITFGVRKDRAANDSDFSSLQNDPEFRELTGTVQQRNSDADRT